jgi:tetratricopeptide (TPR) repeat protein
MRVQTKHYAFLAMVLTLAGCQHSVYAPKSNWNVFSWASAAAPAKPEPTPVPNAGQRIEMQMSMGESLEREGRLDEAMGIYQGVLKKDDRRTDAYQRLAIVNDQLGNFQESDKLYRTALKREPKNADLLCDRGYSLYLQNRDSEAEEVLRQALGINPRLARAHNNLALVLAHNGRNEQSLEEFARAGCREADARVNLAFCLMARKEWTLARQELQRASNADPNSATTREGLAYLRAKAPADIAQTVPLIALTKPTAPKSPFLAAEATQPTVVSSVAPSPTTVVSSVAPPQPPQIAPAISRAPEPAPTTVVSTMVPPQAPQNVPAMQRSPDPSPAITMVKATFPEPAPTEPRSVFDEPVIRAQDPVVKLAERALKASEPAPAPANPTPEPTGSVIKLVIPSSAPSNPMPSPELQALSANGQAGFSLPQPKSEIRIVEHTEAIETIKR